MKVSTRMYPSAIKKLSDEQKRAARMVGEQLLHEVVGERVIPFDTGHLQNTATYVDNSEIDKGLVKIAHEAPYAERLYYHPEYNFQTTFNANARGEWWEDWLRGSKKDRAAKLFKMFYKKLTRRYVE